MTSDWSPEIARSLVEALLGARRSGRKLGAGDLPVPPTIDAARAVQAAITAALGDEIEGWKVSVRPDGTAISAPVRPFLRQGRDRLVMPWRPGMGLEVEIAFQLGRLPVDHPAATTPDGIPGFVEAIHLGVETIDGRLAEGSQSPFALFLADSLDNAGYALGAKLPEAILPELLAQNVQISVRGAASWSGIARHPLADPRLPMIAAIQQNAIAAHFPSGIIVTTGSLCGAVPIDSPGIVDISIQSYGYIRIEFE